MARRTKQEIRQYVRPFHKTGRAIRVTIPNGLVRQYNIHKKAVTWHNYIDPKSKELVIGLEIGNSGTHKTQQSGSTISVYVPRALISACGYQEDEWVYFVPMKADPLTFFLRKTKKPPVPKAVRTGWDQDEYVARLKADLKQARSNVRTFKQAYRDSKDTIADLRRENWDLKNGFEPHGDVIDTGYEWEAAIDPTVFKAKAHFRCLWTFHRKHRIHVDIYKDGVPLATYDNYDETVTFKDDKVCKIGSPGWEECLAESGLDGQEFLRHLDECIPYAEEYVERWRAAQYYHKYKPGDD